MKSLFSRISLVTGFLLAFALLQGEGFGQTATLPWIVETVDEPAAGGDVGQFTSLALDADGLPHIAYYDATNANLMYAKFRLNADGSHNWQKLIVVSTGDVGKRAKIALGADGPYFSGLDETNTQLNLFKRNPAEWGTLEINHILDADATEGFSALAAGPSPGSMIHSIRKEAGGSGCTSDTQEENRLYHSWRKTGSNFGCVRVTTTEVSSQLDMAVGTDGFVHVAFSKFAGGETSIGYRRSATPPADPTTTDYAWSGTGSEAKPLPAIATTDVSGGTYLALALDSSRNPQIVYRDPVTKALMYMGKVKVGSVSSWLGEAEVIDNGGDPDISVTTDSDVGYWCDAAVGPGDILHVSYYDATGKKLKYARKPLSGDEGWQRFDVDLPDGTGKTGKLSSIGVHTDGSVHISYYDEEYGSLRYAKLPANLCGNLTCEASENAASCPQDCRQSVCGNNACEPLGNPAESSSSCIQDCHTGNGFCDVNFGETTETHPAECPVAPTPPVCGDGTCATGESADSCFKDCHCGNAICDSGHGESNATCVQDCPPPPPPPPICNSNGTCDSGETAENCAADCPVTEACNRNGTCDAGETTESCASDCLAVTTGETEPSKPFQADRRGARAS